jgi:hypothetical protein
MPLRGTRYGLVVVVLTQDKVTWSWSFLSKCRCGVGIHSLHAHGLIGKVATWASGNRSRGRGCHGGGLRKVLDGACQRDAPVAGEGPGSGIRSTTSLMLRGAKATGMDVCDCESREAERWAQSYCLRYLGDNVSI